MHFQNMDLIESLQRSFFNVRKAQKGSNLTVLLPFANFLTNGLITFPYVLHAASW